MADQSNSTEGTPGAEDGGTESAPGGVPPSPTGTSEVSDTLQLTAGLVQSADGFDPSIHATDSAGNPLLKKGGGFARKRGRKPGEGSTAAAPQPGATPGTPAAPVAPKIPHAQAAAMLTVQLEAGMIGLLGPEWQLESKEETLAVKASIQSYLEATGGLDLSPGWGLAWGLSGYALPRLPRPETQRRLGQVKDWFARALLRFRSR